MKINYKNAPHALIPEVSEFFGGGKHGMATAFIFHGIVGKAMEREDDPRGPVKHFVEWLEKTYAHTHTSPMEALKSIEDAGFITYRIRKNEVFINLTDIGLDYINSLVRP